MTKCTIISPQSFFYWNILLSDYPALICAGFVWIPKNLASLEEMNLLRRLCRQLPLRGKLKKKPETELRSRNAKGSIYLILSQLFFWWPYYGKPKRMEIWKNLPLRRFPLFRHSGLCHKFPDQDFLSGEFNIWSSIRLWVYGNFQILLSV